MGALSITGIAPNDKCGRTCSTKNETFCVVPTFCILLRHHSFYTDAAIIMFCPCSKGCLPHKRAVSTRSPRVASPDGMSPKRTLVYESANWCALEQRPEVRGMTYARARLAARQLPAAGLMIGTVASVHKAQRGAQAHRGGEKTWER